MKMNGYNSYTGNSRNIGLWFLLELLGLVSILIKFSYVDLSLIGMVILMVDDLFVYVLVVIILVVDGVIFIVAVGLVWFLIIVCSFADKMIAIDVGDMLFVVFEANTHSSFVEQLFCCRQMFVNLNLFFY